MRINVLEVIKDYEGKDFTATIENPNWKAGDPPQDRMKEEPVTVRKICMTALNAVLDGEKQTGLEKTKIFQISSKLYGSSEVDFTEEQLEFVKERVGKVYNALCYGRICQILEGQGQVIMPPHQEGV